MPTIDLARRTLLAVLSLIVLAGCSAHGFDRGKLSQSLGEDEPRQITDQDIKSALARKPQLHFPFKLAVELRSATECQNCAHVPWREADKQKILA